MAACAHGQLGLSVSPSQGILVSRNQIMHTHTTFKWVSDLLSFFCFCSAPSTFHLPPSTFRVPLSWTRCVCVNSSHCCLHQVYKETLLHQTYQKFMELHRKHGGLHVVPTMLCGSLETGSAYMLQGDTSSSRSSSGRSSGRSSVGGWW